MAKIIKPLGEKVTEETVKGLVGKLIHVPTNQHTFPQENTTINAWFAGQVAGYEKAYIKYDYEKGEFMEEPHLFFNVLLTDGKGYLLELVNSEIVELTEDEWNTMVAEYQAKTTITEVEKELIVPERKIILAEGVH
jgi:hypothetical protein